MGERDKQLSKGSLYVAVGQGVFLLTSFVLYAILARFLAAPLLADLLRDPELTGYLRVASLDMAGMSAYAYYRGFLNGKQAFRQLASAIAAYGLTKLLVSSLLVFAGWGGNGALVGTVG